MPESKGLSVEAARRRAVRARKKYVSSGLPPRILTHGGSRFECVRARPAGPRESKFTPEQMVMALRQAGALTLVDVVALMGLRECRGSFLSRRLADEALRRICPRFVPAQGREGPVPLCC